MSPGIEGTAAVNTMMARLWILGMVLGLAYGIYSGGGVVAIAIMPLVGGTAGLIFAMFLDELRSKLRKRRG